MNGHDAPPDIRQVESLILSLYEPNPPEVIAKNQAVLSQLQSTQAAWSLARSLLDLPDEKVKFFGVLTIIVKLNTESATLSKENAEELLSQLLGWYGHLFSAQSPGIVARKLATALSTFFIRFHEFWPQILRHITHNLNSYLTHTHDRHIAHHVTIRATTWVLTSILEDCAKLDLNAPNNMKLYTAVLSNTDDATELLAESLEGESVPSNTLEDALKCVQAWVSFCIRASVRGSGETEPLRQLMTKVVKRLALSKTGEVTLELLTEVLNSYPTLLTGVQSAQLLTALSGPESQNRLQRLIVGDDDFELVSFGSLLLAFAEANHENLMQNMDHDSQLIISMIRDLLSISGHPVVEDRLFVPAIEFWSTYAETLADEMLSDDSKNPEPWVQQALGHVINAISHAWQRIIYPSQEEWTDWDSADRVGFQDARKDVVDLLQATYALVGPKVVVTFSDLALEAINSRSWSRAEAALYCLGGLSDCARDDARCDGVLATVFDSPLFALLQSDGAGVPSKLRQVSVSLIEKYTDYFERNTAHLPTALQLLFSVVGEPAISASAARSIQRLCSSCRHHLQSEAQAFLEMYHSVVSGRGLECMVSERVMGGIAAVAQAIPDEAYRYEICSRLLDIVDDDLKRAKELAASPTTAILPCAGTPRCFNEAEESAPMHVALRALKSLLNIGKGFKALADGPLDLDRTAELETSPEVGTHTVHRRILMILTHTPQEIGRSSETIDVACNILRSGFAETCPGPFVFAPEDVVKVLMQYTTITPGIGYAVSTGCALVNSLKDGGMEGHRDALVALLQWAVGLLNDLEVPETDTELTQNGIEFVSRIVYKAPATLLLSSSPELIEFFFVFTLKVLVGKEPLPKAAAAEFWTNFVGLKTDQKEVQGAAATMMQTLGPMLCQALATNISGHASRSELVKLSEPVKKLVACYPQSKEWLDTAFRDSQSTGTSISPQERSLFVKKIISLRGARTTNQVIRDFWLSARGTNFSYASKRQTI